MYDDDHDNSNQSHSGYPNSDTSSTPNEELTADFRPKVIARVRADKLEDTSEDPEIALEESDDKDKRPAGLMIDGTLADWIIKLRPGEIIYVGDREWHYWSGYRYIQDRKKSPTICQIYEEVLDEMAGFPVPVFGRKTKKELEKWINRHRSTAKRKTVLEYLATHPDVYKKEEEINANPDLTCGWNGTYDLATGQLREHRKEDLITQSLACDIYVDGEAPDFDAFLESRWPGDEEVPPFLIEKLGQGLTRSLPEGKVICFTGITKTGKSTLCNELAHIGGSKKDGKNISDGGYTDAVPKHLVLQKAKGHSHTSELIGLDDIRIGFVPEVNRTEHYDECFIKARTGGDMDKPRALYRNTGRTCTPNMLFLIMGNSDPQLDGSDSGNRERYLIARFKHQIPEEKRIPELLKKGFPHERAAIAGKLLKAAHHAKIHGSLPVPASIRSDTDRFFADRDPIGLFLGTQCEKARGEVTRKIPLWKRFNAWYKDEYNKSCLIKKSDFFAELKAHGYEYGRADTIKDGKRLQPSGILGIRLKDPNEAD